MLKVKIVSMQDVKYQLKPTKLTRVETSTRLKKLSYTRDPDLLLDGRIWDGKEVSQYVAKTSRLMWTVATAAQLPSLTCLAEALFSEAWVLGVSREQLDQARRLVSSEDKSSQLPPVTALVEEVA
jgi:hypothetical protein